MGGGTRARLAAPCGLDTCSSPGMCIKPSCPLPRPLQVSRGGGAAPGAAPGGPGGRLGVGGGRQGGARAQGGWCRCTGAQARAALAQGAEPGCLASQAATRACTALLPSTALELCTKPHASAAPRRATAGWRRTPGCARWAATRAWPGARCHWRWWRAGGGPGWLAGWLVVRWGCEEGLLQAAGDSCTPAAAGGGSAVAAGLPSELRGRRARPAALPPRHSRRVSRVLWPPACWGALPPRPCPSGSRVVGKAGSLEFLHPPEEADDWWS